MNDSKVLFTSTEDEKLVEIVAKYPSLYDKQNSIYKRQVVKDNAWKEIAEHLGRSAEDCKKRWRNIRDTYKRRIRKEKSIYSSSSRAKKWALAEMLSFLHNVENKRSSGPISNIGSGSINNNDVDDSSNLDYENSDAGINESGDVFQDFPSSETIQNDKDNSSEHYNKRNSKPSMGFSRQSSMRKKLNEKILKLMEELVSERNDILKVICQREEDSVDLFYRSVAMSVKQLRSELINEAKIKTLQLLFELEKRNSVPLAQPGIESACSSRSSPSPE